MSRRYCSAVPAAAVILVGLVTACGPSTAVPDPPPLTAADIDGERLWVRITGETDYRDYPEWPDRAGLMPGQSPHGVWHRLYGNPTLFDALPRRDARAPEGAILVKENYDNNKNLVALTVMAKVADFDPDNGDWFWASYRPDGTVNAAGGLGGCISCHEGMRSNDFVIINPLDEAP